MQEIKDRTTIMLTGLPHAGSLAAERAASIWQQRRSQLGRGRLPCQAPDFLSIFRQISASTFSDV